MPAVDAEGLTSDISGGRAYQKRNGRTDIALTDRFLIVTMLGWVIVFGLLIYG